MIHLLPHATCILRRLPPLTLLPRAYPGIDSHATFTVARQTLAGHQQPTIPLCHAPTDLARTATLQQRRSQG